VAGALLDVKGTRKEKNEFFFLCRKSLELSDQNIIDCNKNNERRRKTEAVFIHKKNIQHTKMKIEKRNIQILLLLPINMVLTLSLSLARWMLNEMRKKSMKIY
jgi:hypothetical protein